MVDDEKYIRMAIETAKVSKRNGNLPFGCILIDENGEVLLRGENTINTDSDCLAHAEINLIREASKKYDFSYLNNCSIYTSDEPCPMCTSAIYWSGIGRLVYGLSKTNYYKIVGRNDPNWVFEMPVRELLEKGGRELQVVGPMLEEEASTLHKSD
ncbi:nucleoside deaminase [Flagellimonas sp.]|uniref:nucleoside deaminase n=1 Tax=Flagellimonas sp. TaxID=2058762 RepID=UPI003B5055EF